ncbi:MAG: S-layer homology domain-containing protein [Chroococcales cyanobacterium]
MSKINRFKSATAVLLSLSLSGGVIAPIVTTATLIAPTPVVAQTTTFSDVSSSYWASPFIYALVDRGIIAGFPDGTFRPNAPVTRAQYAAMVRKAFQLPRERSAINFVDVASNYWARDAIREAYEMGLLAGYPGSIFRPEQNIPREQVLVSLANGLDYAASGSVSEVLDYYNDASGISSFARGPIAAATQEQLVVNYPNLRSLNPTQNATRAEVAAFIYQALVSQGRAETIASQYVVNPTPVAQNYRIPSGTTLPVTYNKEKILLTKDETLPVTLSIPANITTNDGKVLIPAGSEVKGELQPVDGGTQFVAQELILANGETLSIQAQSGVITDTETIREGMSVTNIVKNTAIGTAAAAAIAAVTGDRAIATEEVLIGAGAGAVYSLISTFLGRDSIELLVVEPNTDLDLTLTNDLMIEAQ